MLAVGITYHTGLFTLDTGLCVTIPIVTLLTAISHPISADRKNTILPARIGDHVGVRIASIALFPGIANGVTAIRYTTVFSACIWTYIRIRLPAVTLFVSTDLSITTHACALRRFDTFIVGAYEGTFAGSLFATECLGAWLAASTIPSGCHQQRIDENQEN